MAASPRRVLQVLAGLILGLGIMEGVFWLRDDGAFPHVNFYQPDAELGVRLAPLAQARVQLLENPLTQIRINSLGYRGAEPPDPDPQEILVVGDSQVFGLGVEEDETFSQQLAALTQRPVFNAGVPTYGPEEYTAVVAEQLEQRSPSTVIYTLNFVNDLFEAKRPNRERHTVWDGWAVRIETAPETITPFPGRSWLMGKSHAVYALRRLLHDAAPGDAGFDSEGSWRDVTERSERSRASQDEQSQQHQERLESRSTLDRQLQEIESEVETAMFEAYPELSADEIDARWLVQASHGNPGDILSENAFEASRDILVTAQVIRKGVRFRSRLEARLDALRSSKAERVREAITQRDQLASQRAAYRTPLDEAPLAQSPLMPHIREVQELCAKHGAELLVLMLPIDVQVSSDEWAKYGVDEPIDMLPTRVLLSDLARDTEQQGIRAVDSTLALEAAEPGAFLDGDIHMTPRGHQAVAQALAERLAAPPPVVWPEPGLPEGRTWPPAHQDWLRQPERTVYGSSKARCETVQIDEWLRISCLPTETSQPTGVSAISGDHGEATTITTAHATTLITPLFPGEPFSADFTWTDRRQQLTVEWEEDETGTLRSIARFSTRQPGGQPLAVSPEAQALCDCHISLYPEQSCQGSGQELSRDGQFGWGGLWDCEDSCGQLFGGPSADCSQTWPEDCAMMLACAQGDPLAQPDCPEGSVNAGGTGACFTLCDAAHPCEEGSCQPWQGSGICW